ncbi:MAG TPA: hypothetical protein HPP50_06375 [Rhodospirillaceae bacterium]|nr:hypothetical protein [Rhodospirillaceae bacterium]
MRKVIPAVLVVVLAVSASTAADKITLKQRYPAGTYVMTTEADMKQDITMAPAGEMRQNIKMLMAFEMTAEKPAADKTQVVHISYKRIKMSMTGGPMELTFDSERPPVASEETSPVSMMMWQMHKPLVGAKFDITIDGEGKPVKVTGMDRLWEEMGKANPAAAPMMANMKKSFGDETMKMMFSQTADQLPKAPVAVGEKWKANQVLPMPMLGNMTIEQECTLKEVRKTSAGRIARIDFVGNFSKGKPKAGANAAPMGMTISKMAGQQTGTIRFNVDTGMVVEMVTDQKMTMEMAPPGQEGAAPAMTMKQNGQTRMTLTKGKYKSSAAGKSSATSAKTKGF